MTQYRQGDVLIECVKTHARGAHVRFAQITRVHTLGVVARAVCDVVPERERLIKAFELAEGRSDHTGGTI